MHSYNKKNIALFLYVLLVALAASSTSSVVRSEELILVADEWCPYNCTPGNKNPGYLVEIVQYSLEKAGYTLTYKIVPWNRAIKRVESGNFHGIIGAGKQETPSFIFHDLPLFTIEHRFYTLTKNTWQYENIDSLKTINLGVIKDYSYGTLYNEYIKNNAKLSSKITTLHGDDEFERLILLLEREQIDAFVEDKNIVGNYIRNAEKSPSLRTAGKASSEAIYIAFSPALPNSKQYAKAISEGFAALQASGKIDALKLKYHLTD